MRLRARELGGVFLIGFGFFAISVAWASYNAYLPLILNGLGLSTTMIGVVMALDNVFGMTIQPLAGMISDRTRSRWGRRLPFAMIGAPVCAVALVLMPFAAEISAGLLIGLIGVYTLVMATWRTPIVALMPDLVASGRRSRANGVINFMGSLGSVLMFAVGGVLLGAMSYQGPFGLSALLMVAAIAVLVLVVREPAEFRSRRFTVLGLGGPAAPEAVPGAVATGAEASMESDAPVRPQAGRAARRGVVRTVREVIAPPLGLRSAAARSLGLMLAAIFLYTLGGNALETFITLYLNQELGVPEERVTATLLPYVVASIVFAIPAGYLGQRFGRRNSMMAGLIGSAALFAGMFFVRDIGTLTVLMPVFGVLWITVIVNALPLVVEMGGVRHTGTLAAYYYLAGSLGAVISPVVFGVLRDATGNFGLVFWYAAAGFLAGAAALSRVRHGEAVGTEAPESSGEDGGLTAAATPGEDGGAERRVPVR